VVVDNGTIVEEGLRVVAVEAAARRNEMQKTTRTDAVKTCQRLPVMARARREM
jgi:hypothetical protein